jgi:hypothetical protein
MGSFDLQDSIQQLRQLFGDAGVSRKEGHAGLARLRLHSGIVRPRETQDRDVLRGGRGS